MPYPDPDLLGDISVAVVRRKLVRRSPFAGVDRHVSRLSTCPVSEQMDSGVISNPDTLVVLGLLNDARMTR